MKTAATLADQLTSVERLSRDLKTAASTLSPREARYLVDSYYIFQGYRMQASSQIRALGKSEEPHLVIDWLAIQTATLEKQLQRALDEWSLTDPTGQWARGIVGIGPVIAAGLLARIDITKAPTAGAIWSYAGLNPTAVWGKGEKRPWNDKLKSLTWKIGESFVKVQNHSNDYYGKIYAERKIFEAGMNDGLKYADQARISLATKNYGDDTDAKKWYLQDKLPPARIHERAKRYAVKLFLSHYHTVAYRNHYGTEPPLPYPIAHLEHTHYIAPPFTEEE